MESAKDLLAFTFKSSFKKAFHFHASQLTMFVKTMFTNTGPPVGNGNRHFRFSSHLLVSNRKIIRILRTLELRVIELLKAKRRLVHSRLESWSEDVGLLKLSIQSTGLGRKRILSRIGFVMRLFHRETECYVQQAALKQQVVELFSSVS